MFHLAIKPSDVLRIKVMRFIKKRQKFYLEHILLNILRKSQNGPGAYSYYYIPLFFRRTHLLKLKEKDNDSSKSSEIAKRRISVLSTSSSLLMRSVFPSKEDNMKILHWLKEPQFYLVSSICMTSNLFANISLSYITFYVTYTIDLPEEMIAVIPLVMCISGILTSVITKFLTAKFGNKIPFGLSCIIGLSIFILNAYNKFESVQLYV